MDYLALAKEATSRLPEPAPPETADARKARNARKASHVVVDAIEARPGPVHLNAWTTVLHPERCIAADLASLERVVPALAAARQAGDRRGVERGEGELAGLLERLAACGARVRVEEVAP